MGKDMNYKLTVDIGSTKSLWLLTEVGSSKIIDKIELTGFNINHDLLHTEHIFKDLNKFLLYKDLSLNITKVDYFIAGYEKDLNQDIDLILKYSTEYINLDVDINIENDVYLSVKGVIGDNDGIVCILGTGCNIVQQKDGIIKNVVPSLGHIINDYCSGSLFGKQLLKFYFDKSMPAGLRTDFKEDYKTELIQEVVIDSLYKQNCNKYLGQFFYFVIKNKKDRFIKDLIYNNIQELLGAIIRNTYESSGLEINFTGSISHLLSDDLRDYIYTKKIIKNPITEYLNYETR